jgi:hypothetical protein
MDLQAFVFCMFNPDDLLVCLKMDEARLKSKSLLSSLLVYPGCLLCVYHLHTISKHGSWGSRLRVAEVNSSRVLFLIILLAATNI